MAPRRLVNGKEAMASHRAAFLAARDRTHGKEAMASHHAEFIAAGGQTIRWADFEAAMAEWVVDLEAAKAAQKALLEDAANATLRSETLRETVCNALIANGDVKTCQKRAKCLRWLTHQTRFRF